MKISLIILFILCGCSVYAQNPSVLVKPSVKQDSALLSGKNTLSAALNYTTNAVFMGRADQYVIPIISPEIKYTLKSGLFFNGSISSVPLEDNSLVDGGTIGAGYSRQFGENLNMELAVAKIFYNANSDRISSAIRGTGSYSISYDFGSVLSISSGTDYNINRSGIRNDIFNEFDISHEIDFDSLFVSRRGKISLTPKFAVNLGTENFYSPFLIEKKLKGKKQTARQSAELAAYQTSLKQYKLLDYELMLPAEFTYKRFTYTLIPTVAFAKNALPPAVEAELSARRTVFYIETGLAYLFK